MGFKVERDKRFCLEHSRCRRISCENRNRLFYPLHASSGHWAIENLECCTTWTIVSQPGHGALDRQAFHQTGIIQPEDTRRTSASNATIARHTAAFLACTSITQLVRGVTMRLTGSGSTLMSIATRPVLACHRIACRHCMKSTISRSRKKG